MKNEYNQLDKPSLLYMIITEMVFLEETKRLIHDLKALLKSYFGNIIKKFKRFIKNEWTQASMIISGYMVVSSILVFIAYKLVMIF